MIGATQRVMHATRTLMLSAVLAAPMRPLVRRGPEVFVPSHIVLIRHAEEPSDNQDPHLSKQGRVRADHFVEFMTHDPEMIRLGAPVAIYATEMTNDGNGVRTQETVAPLAKVLNLDVKTPFHAKDYDKLATLILSDHALSGKTVVVCWNHEYIPQLAQALGITGAPSKWKNKVYDEVYVISYRGGKATLTTQRYE